MPQSSSDSDQSERLCRIVARAAEFLCVEGRGRLGSWGDTRTSASAIRAICDSGVSESCHEFIEYSLDRLLSSPSVEKDAEGLSFNWEVWDTSVALIALKKGAPREYSDEIAALSEWLVSEAPDDNFKDEPWETLWGLHALLLSGRPVSDVSPLTKRCIAWLLTRRNPDGVLISPHYMAFLLTVLNQVIARFRLRANEKRQYESVTNVCTSYLKTEFIDRKEEGTLWGDQPWLIGHILLGIAGSPASRTDFFDDEEFNDYLVNWYEEKWDPQYGWVDVLDTVGSLIGLSNYYVEREAFLRGSDEAGKTDIRAEVASLVDFRFEKVSVPRDMTIRPRWQGRDFKVSNNECFLLMPFRLQWSPGIRLLLEEIVNSCGLTLKRADDMFRPDIMEDIWTGINQARMVIADCTKQNANVFYELGMAHTVGKDVIILSQNHKDAPFDIRHLRYVHYSNDEDGYRKLRDVLPKHIDAILRGR